VNRSIPENLAYHEHRMFSTQADLWGVQKKISLAELITVPEMLRNDLLKCRITYKENIENVELEPYQLRSVKTLKIVFDDRVSYRYKYKDRTILQQLFDQRGLCDDVLIIRDGFITDTSYCNVALFDGNDWYTPDTNLLPGTQRAFLLDQKLICERRIAHKDLNRFIKVRLFNAMIKWENEIDVAVKQIF